MEQMIPGFLEEMLKKQYGEEVFAKILAGYQARRPVTLRVNPLKADRNSVEQALTGAGIAFKNVSWYEDAMIIEGAREPEIQELPIYKEGGIYLQSLSSMLPPLALAPQEGADILMIKPAMPYLDLVRECRDRFDLPVAAYQVSGEYAMIKAAAKAGLIDEYGVMCESAVSIFRAGADILITYFACELADAIRKGDIG